MSTPRDLIELQRCLDDDRVPASGLLQRLETDPRLRRRSRALRQVDAGLRAELEELGRAPVPPVGQRALDALGPRARRQVRPTAARRLLPALAAALLAWVAWPVADAPPAPAARPDDATSSPGLVLRWATALETAAPEAALVEEARRLADDTRQAARSLWSGLPLAGWMAREDGTYPH